MFGAQREFLAAAIERLAAQLPAEYRPDELAHERIAKWNNEPQRTQADVPRALRPRDRARLTPAGAVRTIARLAQLVCISADGC
jgi:primosomal protein N''